MSTSGGTVVMGGDAIALGVARVNPPGLWYSNASLTVQQTRGGTTNNGDGAVGVLNPNSGFANKMSWGVTDNGAMFGDSYWVLSGSHDPTSQQPFGPGAAANGSEPFMLGLMPDVNGPTIAVQAASTISGGGSNAAAIAFYDSNDAIARTAGGGDPVGTSLGKKKAMFAGNGDFYLGANLSTTPGSSADITLGRVAAFKWGHKTNTGNETLLTAYLQSPAQGAYLQFSSTGNAITLAANTGAAAAVTVAALNGTTFPIADFQVNGTSRASITKEGALASSSGAYAGATATGGTVSYGTGAPNNANGANGDIYLRVDGAALTTIYQRRLGAWVGIV